MLKSKKIFAIIVAFSMIFACFGNGLWQESSYVMAENIINTNMTEECNPYFLKDSSVESSIEMGGEKYITPAIKTRIFNSHIFLCTQVFCVQICESLSLVRFAILT